MIGRSMFLELAQGFGLVTPDPFSSHELGGVWARDYLFPSPFTFLLPSPSSFRLALPLQYISLTVSGFPCSACMMKLLTTRPAFRSHMYVQ